MEQSVIAARLPVVGKMRIYFSCLAEKCHWLYTKCNEFERQKQVKHLGIIPSVFECVSHTRYEYLLLQCAICDMSEAIHKGYANAQGQLKIDGTSYSGNALLKTWFMLSNFGHCKNTVSDEKAILSYAHNHSKFKRDLLSPIKDESVKKWCKKVIQNYDYMNFHNVLSFRRIYKELPRRVSLKTELVNAFKLLLIPITELRLRVNENKLKILRRLHDNIRHLSMIGIDSHYSHSTISIDITSALLDLNDGEQLHKNRHIASSLSPFINMLCEDLYLEPAVLAHQKSYEISAKKQIHSAKNCNSVIHIALNKGISNTTTCNLKHFARFLITKDMQSNASFHHELRRINLVTRYCRNAASSLDIFPHDSTWCADFFINTDKFKPNDIPPLLNFQSELIEDQLSHFVQNMAQPYIPIIAAATNAAQKLTKSNELLETIRSSGISAFISSITNVLIDRLNPAFKELLWGLIRFVLKEKYVFDIESGRGDYESFGFYSTSADLGCIRSNIDKAIAMESTDKNRTHELKQLRQSSTRKFDGYTLCCIARITIYDTTKPPDKRQATDIDGVVLKISNNVTILEFHESKNQRHAESAAFKDIQTKLIPTLNQNAKGYRIKKVKNYGAKLVIRFSTANKTS